MTTENTEFLGKLSPLAEAVFLRMSDPDRFKHTLSVARECVALSEIFALHANDRDELITAALLHDIAKGFSLDEFLMLDKKYSVNFTSDDLASPAVLHAKAGAKIALHDFPEFASENVCKAISEHTTGKENMSLISKLLFIADYIEPNRKWTACKETGKYYRNELAKSQTDKEKLTDLTVLRILEETFAHLKEKGCKVHPDSIKCKEFLLKTIE